jgi:hypothetical protein
MRGNSLKPHESQGLTACGKDDISDRGVALSCFEAAKIQKNSRERE